MFVISSEMLDHPEFVNKKNHVIFSDNAKSFHCQQILAGLLSSESKIRKKFGSLEVHLLAAYHTKTWFNGGFGMVTRCTQDLRLLPEPITTIVCLRGRLQAMFNDFCTATCHYLFTKHFSFNVF
jgi:hypothetical protein